MSKYQLHTDCGHTWLRVPKQEVRKLSLILTTGSTSGHGTYVDEDFFYLEEDTDAMSFLDAKEAIGERDDVRGSNVEFFYHDDYCFIRGLNQFKGRKHE